MATTGVKQGSFSESSTQMNPMIYHRQESGKSVIFWVAVALSQIIGVICVVLAIHMGNLYGGFLVTDKNLMFNYHPLFMTLGLIVFYGDAIIVYRVLSFLPKPILKLIHAALHISAIVFSSLALVAVFENHRRSNLPDLYSLHSWVGIAAFSFFFAFSTSEVL